MASDPDDLARRVHAMQTEKVALVKLLATHKQAVKLLLQDHFRRHISSAGPSFPLATKHGLRADPQLVRNSDAAIMLMQRLCDELDKERAGHSRVDNHDGR